MENGSKNKFSGEMVIPIASAITIIITVLFSQTIFMSPTTSAIIMLLAVGLLCEFFYAVAFPVIVRLLSHTPSIRKCAISIVIAVLTLWTVLIVI